MRMRKRGFLAAVGLPLLIAVQPIVARTSEGMLSAQKSGTSEAKKASKKVTDPVCGMEVDPKNAPSATYKGKKFYFCSVEDRAKFEKSPEKFHCIPPNLA